MIDACEESEITTEGSSHKASRLLTGLLIRWPIRPLMTGLFKAEVVTTPENQSKQHKAALRHTINHFEVLNTANFAVQYLHYLQAVLQYLVHLSLSQLSGYYSSVHN